MKNTENIEQISAAFLALTTEMLALEKAIKSDAKQGYSIYVPTTKENAHIDSRELAIKSIGRVRASPDMIKSGLLCASASTIKAIEKLNMAKAAFKATVIAIKGNVHKSSSTIQRLIQFAPNQVRDKALSRALRAIGGQAFDLRTCYANIQILPKDTTSVSWTWAMRHKRIKKYTVDEAFELSERLSDENAKLAADIQLGRLPKNEVLIQKMDIPPQLKANIKFLEEGSEVRKSITVSGMLVIQGKSLPVHLYREQPETSTLRLSRPKMSEDTLYVPTLNMYRYASAQR